MPSVTSPLKIFLERRKKSRDVVVIDDSAIVKAAAWAWYQHSSGSEGKPMGEFDVTRTRQAPRASRYKLQAMENSQTSCPIYANNSLFDSYEIQSISKQIDDLIDSSSNRFFHGENVPTSKKKKEKVLNGLWLRSAVVCGTREDVDTRAFAQNRRPARHF